MHKLKQKVFFLRGLKQQVAIPIYSCPNRMLTLYTEKKEKKKKAAPWNNCTLKANKQPK